MAKPKKSKKILKYFFLIPLYFFAALGFLVALCFTLDKLGVPRWNSYWINVSVTDHGVPVKGNEGGIRMYSL